MLFLHTYGIGANLTIDEAHNIKNRQTKNAHACCALQGTYRWCLTGTPLYVFCNAISSGRSEIDTIVYRQNNVEELYSLLNFLRIRPLNDWSTFNEQIAKPVKSGKGTRAMKRLHVRCLIFRGPMKDVCSPYDFHSRLC